MSEMGPLLPKDAKKYQRCVSKTGVSALIEKKNVHYKYYASDMFTNLVNLRWRYVLLIFVFVFLITWFLFGVLWWIIAYGHGDLKSSPYNTTDPEPCVTLVDDMTSAFLFSMETQYTTGYGTRSPTPQCPEAIFLLCFQSIFGMLLQAVMVGVVFAKLARPKARSQAIIFSKKATIFSRDGFLCFSFRVADIRKSCLVGCKLRAWILKHRISKEGEPIPYHQTKLRISVENGGSDFFLLWPVTVIHRIDSSSPFKEINLQEWSSFEIVVSLTCTVETTGQMTEVRTSYTFQDILRGHRFQNMIVRNETGLYVDYALFDKTTCVESFGWSGKRVDTPPRKSDDGKSIIFYESGDEEKRGLQAK